MLKWIFLLTIAPASFSSAAVIDSKQYHLRSGATPEWDEFAPKTPQGKRLDLRFDSRRNTGEATLFIRQYNVKLDWRVELNGARLASLVLMEDPLVSSFAVPAGTLRNGVNTLSIVPPRENDDIVVGPFALDPRPFAAAHDGTIHVNVTDADTGQGLPCRITLADPSGALAPLRNAGADFAALRPGVAYVSGGAARLGLPQGDYVVHAGRGFEYSVATQRVSIASGSVTAVELKIRREVPTPGLVSCDTHIHTFTHAKHGDATLDERMLTLAGEGVELPISTEHNMLVDFAEPAKRLGVDAYFTPVIGCEVTTRVGHFNVFPVQPGSPVPDHRLTDWPALMKAIRATPEVQVAILNHPQDVHSGFVPFAATNLNGASGENLRGFEFSFDAVELINSGALRSDLMEVYRNWFSLLNYGYRIAGVGASDSHDVSRFIVGQGRTYVACADGDAGKLNVAEAMRGLRKGRSYVSLGLLPLIRVDGRHGPGDVAGAAGESTQVEITVLGPSWANADKLELFQNGRVVVERQLAPTTSVEKTRATLSLPRPPFDTYLVVIATGPGVRAPHWAIPRPYQPSSGNWQPRILGSSNPIWLDGDGDGKFTPAREYARPLVEKYAQTPQELFQALSKYDFAVAAQAASLLKAKGIDITRADIRTLIARANAPVKEGFLSYLAALETRR
jgi:hypothetical protein